MLTALAIVVAIFASERVPLDSGGRFSVPRANEQRKCYRLVATPGTAVKVNGIAAGDAGRVDGVLDITGFLRLGSVNTVEAHGASYLLVSPLVYLESAELDRKTGVVRVTVANTTEHTMQVEIATGVQFTVSPGTSMTREMQRPTASGPIRMRATSDGLDLVFEDEIPVEEHR